LRLFKEFLITLLIAIVIFIGLQISIKSFEVFNVSMQPTYYEGDLIIVNKLAYHFENPKRGEVIVLYAPGSDARPVLDLFFTQHTTQFIKRIVGLPGDSVEIMNQQVFVNGIALTEPYIKEPPKYFYPEQVIPAGKYFVLGDNRNNSNDSHTGWLVPRDDIIGKVWFRYWTADYPDIRFVMIPIFGVIVSILLILVILDAVKGTKTE
jgi:signal peptidase I